MECPLNRGLGDELTVGYVARTLDAFTNSAFERHARACPQCKEVLAAQQTVWESLEAWLPAPISSDFDKKLFRRLQSSSPAQTPAVSGAIRAASSV